MGACSGIGPRSPPASSLVLKENGIYILEVMNTGPLATDGPKESMCVLGQARIKGTAQMIINPVAIN